MGKYIMDKHRIGKRRMGRQGLTRNRCMPLR